MDNHNETTKESDFAAGEKFSVSLVSAEIVLLGRERVIRIAERLCDAEVLLPLVIPLGHAHGSYGQVPAIRRHGYPYHTLSYPFRIGIVRFGFWQMDGTIHPLGWIGFL